MFKKAAVLTHPTLARQDAPLHRQGRKRNIRYVEPLNDVRTKLEDFFNIMLVNGDESIRNRILRQLSR
jgi:hypothetical protein